MSVLGEFIFFESNLKVSKFLKVIVKVIFILFYKGLFKIFLPFKEINLFFCVLIAVS